MDGWKPLFLCVFAFLCSGVARAWGKAHFGKGSNRVWLDEVRCTGNELTLEQCPKSAWGEHNCLHSEDAGVSCSPLTGRTTHASVFARYSQTPVRTVEMPNCNLTFSSCSHLIITDGFAWPPETLLLETIPLSHGRNLSHIGTTDNINNCSMQSVYILHCFECGIVHTGWVECLNQIEQSLMLASQNGK